MCIIPNPHKLVVCGYTIIILAFDSTKMKDYADNNYTSSLCYFESSLELVTSSGEKMKKWSMLTGEIDRIHIGESVDSCMGYDTGRSLVYAATRNRVSVFNSKNMFKIK